MKKLDKIYEGKAKIMYLTTDPNLLIQYFKDDATAFDGQKKGQIVNKGILNNQISSHLFERLEAQGISTHFVSRLSDREMLVKKLDIIPVELIVRNVVAGSLAKRMGLAEGTPLKERVLELYYKNDALHDPMLNEYHIRTFGLAADEELAQMLEMADRVNKILKEIFARVGIRLIDFKLEFGRHQGDILLGDEITPDGCRLWEVGTDEKMDKDRFRRDLGRVEEAYQEVARRLLNRAESD
ncbi:MAG: phosphoribosylaminoimidazolesuccinocarboxamide synthase [Thermodesulfobacteriota bacterium]